LKTTPKRMPTIKYFRENRLAIRNLGITETSFMRNFIICCCISAASLNASPQKTVDVDKDASPSAFNHMYTVAGTPFVMAKFARVVEGSPFFNEKMMKGALILSEGKEYKSVFVRLNLLETQVNYMNELNIEMIATTPVREVIIWDTIVGKDYRFVSSNYIKTSAPIDRDFYELLQTGKAELYKQHKKQMRETRPYGSATYEQTIQTDIFYFVLVNQQWTRVKKLRDIPPLLADKTTDVQKFISDKRLSGDNQSNFEAVIAYFNSLFVQQ
jgi:hypothetical protein